MVHHEESCIPDEIAQAFYQSGIVEERRLSGGLVNTTLQITDASGQNSILQRLSPIFDETLGQDYGVVSNHLRSEGWEIADPVVSSDERTYVTDHNGSVWRSFTFIESDALTPEVTSASAICVGGLLGKLHDSLSRLNYDPRFSLPHFHETPYYADKLEGLLSQVSSSESRELGRKAIKFSRAQAIPLEPAQLIHGDPKMANVLFKDGHPFTFIDFDTLMKASPLVDVGDMLRSMVSKLMVDDTAAASKALDSTIAAYYEQAKPKVNEKAFLRQAKNAGQVIALELGMRYLIDVVEDNYFNWNETQFDSRGAHNRARAQAQWQTYEALY